MASRKPVDEIALVGLRQGDELVAEQDEGRRPGLGLGHVADLDASAADGGRRVGIDRAFEPTVEPRRRQAPVPGLGHPEGGLEELVDAEPGLPRDRDHRGAADLRQQTLGRFAHLAELRAARLDQVPFVDADHDGTPFPLGEIRDREVLLFERDRGVEQHDHDFGEFHGADRVGQPRVSRACRRCGRACAGPRCRTP